MLHQQHLCKPVLLLLCCRCRCCCCCCCCCPLLLLHLVELYVHPICCGLSTAAQYSPFLLKEDEESQGSSINNLFVVDAKQKNAAVQADILCMHAEISISEETKQQKRYKYIFIYIYIYLFIYNIYVDMYVYVYITSCLYTPTIIMLQIHSLQEG